QFMNRSGGALATLALLAGAACTARPKPAPASVRLADLYKPAMVEGRPAALAERPRIEWRFAGPAPAGKLAATRGWQAGPGVAGPEMRTYTLETRALPGAITASDTRHILLRPTDAQGASFEVESVRLVFRKEHLAGVPSGLGWHGLSEVYRETLVARSPEVIR